MREIVEHHPEQVSEVWCRKVFRQSLQLLERQHAMQLPHRVITPDTVFVHDNGTLLLLPSLISDPMPEIADELTALARIVHYAITREVVPTGPLRGRAPEGFSDSLINAIDRSVAFDPATRPRTIGELRDLLGIVPFLPAPLARQQARAAQAAQPAPPQVPQPKQAVPPRPMRKRRWAWAGAGLAVLSGTGLAIFANLRGAPTFDHLALTLPEPRGAVRARPDTHVPALAPPARPGPQAPAASSTEMPSAGTQVGASAAKAAAGSVHADVDSTKATATTARATKATARQSAGQATAPALVSTPRHAVRETPAQPAAAAAPAPDTAAAAGAVVTLQIQPWGRVYVDGVQRGISPPVKRLTLAPGRHLVLVANPGARDRVLEVDTADGDGNIAVDFDQRR